MNKGDETVYFNRGVFHGVGTLGADFHWALKITPSQSGRQYIEMLVDRNSGQFLEILFPDPTRCYQVTRVQKDGTVVTSTTPLSKSFPDGVLVTFAVDSLTRVVSSLSLHERMNLDVIAVLHSSMVPAGDLDGKLAA